MDLLDKLADAAEHDSGMTLSRNDVLELIDILVTQDVQHEIDILTIDRLGEHFTGKRSTLRN